MGTCAVVEGGRAEAHLVAAYALSTAHRIPRRRHRRIAAASTECCGPSTPSDRRGDSHPGNTVDEFSTGHVVAGL
eukprot:3939446-Rhodomonas_salina.2